MSRSRHSLCLHRRAHPVCVPARDLRVIAHRMLHFRASAAKMPSILSRITRAYRYLIRRSFQRTVSCLRNYSFVSLAKTEQVPSLSICEARQSGCLAQHGDHAAEAPTIFFMPHCDMTLYESVLKANWTLQRLGNMLLIGNPISEYIAKYAAP